MKHLLLFQNFGLWEVLIIAFVVLLIFGGKKIPELMKGLGKGVKSFKEGMSEVEKEYLPSAETASTCRWHSSRQPEEPSSPSMIVISIATLGIIF